MALMQKRPGYSFLVSPDSGLLLEELEKLLQIHKLPDPWEKLVFWGDEEPEESFWSSLRQQGLFAGYRLVLVRRAHEWGASVWKNISASLSRPYDNVWPVFCLEVEHEKGKFKIPAYIQKTGAYAFAQKQGWIVAAPPLAGNGVRKFVEKQAKKRGLVFLDGVMAKFCQLIQPDAVAIATELDKLAMLAPKGEINDKMLESGYSQPEGDAFALLKKMENGDLPGVWQEVLGANASSLLFFLIAILARELRLLWQFECGEAPWVAPHEAAFKKNLARKIGKKGLSMGFCYVAEAELQVKSGRMTPEQALENLAVTMTMLFGGQALPEIFAPHQ